jgi:hypothetical protein
LTTKSKHGFKVTVTTTTTSKTSAVGNFSAYTFTINAAGVVCPSPPQNVTVSTTFSFCGTFCRVVMYIVDDLELSTFFNVSFHGYIQCDPKSKSIKL